MSMSEIERQHARLLILRDLAEQPDGRWNSEALREDLDGRWAINKTRDWIHGELQWLEMMGAVTLTKVASVLIAEITRKGADHVERRLVIEGVKKPSPVN